MHFMDDSNLTAVIDQLIAQMLGLGKLIAEHNLDGKASDLLLQMLSDSEVLARWSREAEHQPEGLANATLAAAWAVLRRLQATFPLVCEETLGELNGLPVREDEPMLN